MQDKILNIGLIGLGNMGQNHLRILSILKHINLACIYDADPKKATELANSYHTYASPSFEDVFTHNLDAVLICTPTSTHYGYINAAAQYIKNIFVEKPMATSPEEAEKICGLVDQNNINLQVGFIERFNPAVQQLKQVLDADNKVISIDFTRTNRLSSRITDVDVIADLMIHDIDLALHINGPIKSVWAHGSVEGSLVNFASAIITHANGKFSRIQASRITEKKIRKIEATCHDVFIDCELFRKEIVINKQSRIHHNEDGAYRISAVQENIEVKPQEALLLELQSFIASCHGNVSSINPNAQDALNALKICQKIQDRIYNDSKTS